MPPELVTQRVLHRQRRSLTKTWYDVAVRVERDRDG